MSLRRLAACIVPGGVLALTPKCPLCLGAYVAMATGIGLSVSAAAILRYAIMAVCVACLVYAARKYVRSRSPAQQGGHCCHSARRERLARDET